MPCRNALHHYRPTVGPATRLFVVLPLTPASLPFGIQELAGKRRLRTTDADIVLLVRNPTPPPTPGAPSSVGRAVCLLNDEPVRIYAALFMRPWIMQACHSTTSCHLGTTRTLHILERFYWSIDVLSLIHI